MFTKHFFRKTALLLTMFATVTFVACGNDDDEADATLQLSNAEGNYSGTFDFTPSASSLNPNPTGQTGVAVALNVKDGKVVFPEFPAATLVTALLGEEGAASMIPMLGTITYEATIGSITADASQFSAALTTPVLRINVGGVLVVLITIEAPTKLVYKKDGSLSFTLKTTKCQLGEGAEAGEPFDLINELSFSVKK